MVWVPDHKTYMEDGLVREARAADREKLPIPREGRIMPPYCEEHRMYHDGSLWECEEMRTRDRIRATEAARREKAERIADEVLSRSFDPSGGWREIVIAAALAALTEKERRS